MRRSGDAGGLSLAHPSPPPHVPALCNGVQSPRSGRVLSVSAQLAKTGDGRAGPDESRTPVGITFRAPASCLRPSRFGRRCVALHQPVACGLVRNRQSIAGYTRCGRFLRLSTAGSGGETWRGTRARSTPIMRAERISPDPRRPDLGQRQPGPRLRREARSVASAEVPSIDPHGVDTAEACHNPGRGV